MVCGFIRRLSVFGALLIFAAHGYRASAEETLAFPFQGIDRHYVLHAAPNQTGPAPLVIALHGLGESIDALRQSWTLDAVADREGFDVVYPEALNGRWAYVDTRPVGLPDGQGLVDDIGFIRALLDKLIADHLTDPARVFVVGVSNGALMAWTLACQMPDRLAGVAPFISGMVERQAQQCRPARLVKLLILAGTEDLTQDYDGAMGENYRLMSVPETLEFWRYRRGCMGMTWRRLPAHTPDDPTAAVQVDWTQCQDPSPQRFWRIEGGGHSLPSFAPLSDRERRRRHGGRSQAIETAEEVAAFFGLSREK
jgi:polyhydroxybutyrate depolymerase